MNLLTCCLLVIVATVVMGAPLSQTQLKLDEIRMDLKTLNKSVLECCFGSALVCFSQRLPQLNTTGNVRSLEKKIVRDLRKTNINVACPACDEYPMRNSNEFIRALETLLQRSCATWRPDA
ncbi:hypothetical protein JZ751_022354 [Albula glossodonta]|uniref:Interleukin n=1 Tax=Albula glossodonta TaxID=121402 RepID=A0A8T2NLE1_9TELE|nr:hypothetical protein JZ751_022354 [Albula glossodonta]